MIGIMYGVFESDLIFSPTLGEGRGGNKAP